MSAPGRFTRVAIVIAGAAVVVSACSAPMRRKSVPVGGTIEEYERVLASNDADLRNAGITPVAGGAGGGAMPDGDGDGVGDEIDDSVTSTTDSARAIEETVSPPAPPANAGEDSEDSPILHSKRDDRKTKDKRVEKRTKRCSRICGLAETSCDLEAQVCDLASRHQGEERYENACARAQAQCEAAVDACNRCQ